MNIEARDSLINLIRTFNRFGMEEYLWKEYDSWDYAASYAYQYGVHNEL